MLPRWPPSHVHHCIAAHLLQMGLQTGQLLTPPHHHHTCASPRTDPPATDLSSFLPYFPQMGLQSGSGHVALFLFVTATFAVAVGALSLTFTVALSTSGQASLVMNLVLLLSLLVGGFFVNPARCESAGGAWGWAAGAGGGAQGLATAAGRQASWLAGEQGWGSCGFCGFLEGRPTCAVMEVG